VFNSHTDGRTADAAATDHRDLGQYSRRLAELRLQPFRSTAFTVLWTRLEYRHLDVQRGFGWLMTSLDPSPFIVSLVQVANTLPMFLLVFLAGVLADLIDRQELRRKFAQGVAIESYKIGDRKAVEHREQKQWVFGMLSKRFSLFYQQACLLGNGFGFRGSIPFDMYEWRYQRDLKSDLLAAQCGRGGENLRHADSLIEMLNSLHIGRAVKRLVAGLAPPLDRLLVKPRLGEVICQYLRFGGGDALKPIAQGFGDATMEDSSSAL
jgi:hypothetical protein